MASRAVSPRGAVGFEIRSERGMRRHATRCNPTQLGATEIAAGKNEPTDRDFEFAATTARKKSSPAKGEL
jgi:hypothetical protein